MKSVAAVLVASLVVSSSAFTGPMLATKAVTPKKAPAKKPVAKKPVAKKPAAKARSAPAPSSAPESKGYPSIAKETEKVRWGNISGGGNKAPPKVFDVPDFSDPKLQIDRDPAFYKAAAKTRLAKTDFAYDDGLTVLERKQRGTIPAFLTGSAKSQADVSTIRGDLEGEDYLFGLDGDRFQLLFITIFGIFTLVGCLSGAIQLD